ncbi:MAG: ATP-binding protein, partial [Pseudobdellovibrionaceae bacterium]
NKKDVIERLINDITTLDLQLENSLWLSQFDNYKFQAEAFFISKSIESLKMLFPEIQIELQKEAEVFTDRRALELVLKNLFHNSILHGKAQKIKIDVVTHKNSLLQISIVDDGQGFQGVAASLGKEILKSQHSKGNGIGLYLCKQLIKRLKGQIILNATADDGERRTSPQTTEKGFAVLLILPGGQR